MRVTTTHKNAYCFSLHYTWRNPAIESPLSSTFARPRTTFTAAQAVKHEELPFSQPLLLDASFSQISFCLFNNMLIKMTDKKRKQDSIASNGTSEKKEKEERKKKRLKQGSSFCFVNASSSTFSFFFLLAEITTLKSRRKRRRKQRTQNMRAYCVSLIRRSQRVSA